MPVSRKAPEGSKKKTPLVVVCLMACGIAFSNCNPPRPRENYSEERDRPVEGDDSNPPVQSMGGAGSELVFADFDCGPEPRTDLPVTKENLLRATSECAQLRYCELEAALSDLARRVRSSPASPSADDSELRKSLLQVMAWVERAEFFRIGPAASSAADMENGRGLRDLIYSWPNVSRCRVEEQVLGKAYETEGFDDLVDVPINARGLFAVEYLAFYEGTDNDCGNFSSVNTGDAWNGTSAAQLGQLKQEYLRAAMDDTLRQASALRAAWDPDDGNFHERFVTASAYMDQHEALNLAARAMLYLDREIKDYKIGVPAGFIEGAPVERPELSFVGGQTAAVAANLVGFRDLYQGCNGQGLGFYDLLAEAGHVDLADEVIEALDDADRLVAGFPELSAASDAELERLYSAIKKITDLVKGDFFGQGSPLGFTLPTSVEGDTD